MKDELERKIKKILDDKMLIGDLINYQFLGVLIEKLSYSITVRDKRTGKREEYGLMMKYDDEDFTWTVCYSNGKESMYDTKREELIEAVVDLIIELENTGI